MVSLQYTVCGTGWRHCRFPFVVSPHGFPPPASRCCRGALPLPRAGICRTHDVTLNWSETAERLCPGAERLFFWRRTKTGAVSSHFSCSNFGVLTTWSGEGFGSGASSQPPPASRHERPAVKEPGTENRRRFTQSRWRSREVSTIVSITQRP